MIKFYTVASNTLLDAKNGVSAQLRKLAAEESGATAIEYGLIAAGIAVAIIGVVFTLGDQISAFFLNIQQQLATKQPG